MRIGEVAKRTGLNISNVRFYERKGLLTPERENESNYREYSEEDVIRIKEILLYRKMGISIESIYLLLNQKADRNEIIARQLSELREQITNLQGSIDLCQMILEDKIIDHEQIDYYLSYIHEEEEKGKRFSEVVELLEDIDDFTQSSLIYWRPWVLHFTRWPWITTLLSTAFWFTILTIPISHIIEVYLGKEKLSVPLLVIFGSILFIFGSNFIKYRKSNRKSR